MADDRLLMIDRIDGILSVTLNSPLSANALSSELVAALTSAFVGASQDGSVRAVLVQATGRHFTTGGDVRMFSKLISEPAAVLTRTIDALIRNANAMVRALLGIEVPVIAACRGIVAGGGLGLVLAADVVVTDASATLLFSHQRLGLPPDGGVSWLLPRVVGHRQASQLVLGAASVGAEDARRMGLISSVVDSADLEREAMRLARNFAEGPALAIRAGKRLLTMSRWNTLDEQLAMERDALLAAVSDPDFVEGVRAFAAHRAPVFPSAS